MFVSKAYAQAGEHAAGHAASVAGGHANRVFPPFDFSFFGSHVFWLIICFGLFYFFMARIVLPRIGGVIEMRRDRIAADLDQAARMKHEADAAVASYEKELAQARERAGAIARTAADEARAMAEAERANAEAALEKRLAASEQHIAGIRDKAMQDVGTIAEETAAEIVHAFVGGKVDRATVTKAVKTAQD